MINKWHLKIARLQGDDDTGIRLHCIHKQGKLPVLMDTGLVGGVEILCICARVATRPVGKLNGVCKVVVSC